MVHLDLFGHSHQFQIADQSPQSIESTIELIQNLALDIPTLQQKERSYLLLLIKVVMLYQTQKAGLGELEERISKLNEVCVMIEKSLEQSQTALIHEV